MSMLDIIAIVALGGKAVVVGVASPSSRNELPGNAVGYACSVHQPGAEARAQHAGNDDEDCRQRRRAVNDLGDLDRNRHCRRFDCDRRGEELGEAQYSRRQAMIIVPNEPTSSPQPAGMPNSSIRSPLARILH